MGWPVPNLFKGQSPREPASIGLNEKTRPSGFEARETGFLC